MITIYCENIHNTILQIDGKLISHPSIHKWPKNGTYNDSGDPTSGSTGTGDVTTQISDQTAINTGEFMFPFVADMSTSGKADFEINFGSPIYTISSGNSDANGYGNFEYAVPSGFYAICTKNIAEYG